MPLPRGATPAIHGTSVLASVRAPARDREGHLSHEATHSLERALQREVAPLRSRLGRDQVRAAIVVLRLVRAHRGHQVRRVGDSQHDVFAQGKFVRSRKQLLVPPRSPLERERHSGVLRARRRTRQRRRRAPGAQRPARARPVRERAHDRASGAWSTIDTPSTARSSTARIPSSSQTSSAVPSRASISSVITLSCTLVLGSSLEDSATWRHPSRSCSASMTRSQL